MTAEQALNNSYSEGFSGCPQACRNKNIGIVAALKREAGVTPRAAFPELFNHLQPEFRSQVQPFQNRRGVLGTVPRLPGFNWRAVEFSNCRYSLNDMNTQPRLEARGDGDFSRTFFRLSSIAMDGLNCRNACCASNADSG